MVTGLLVFGSQQEPGAPGRAVGGEGTATSRGRPASAGSAKLTAAAERGREPGASRSQPVALLGARAARRTPAGGSHVPPSRPPQVSQRSPASSLESSVALPTRSRTARTSRACVPLCLVSSRTSLSTPGPLYKTSGPGERKRKKKKKKDHSQLHYILHHSRHLPCSSLRPEAPKPATRRR